VRKPAFQFSTLALLAAVTGIGCSGGDSAAPVPPPVLTSLTVTLAPASIQVGQTSTAVAAGRDQHGASIAAGSITWSSSAAQVATVSASGTVKGMSPGQAERRQDGHHSHGADVGTISSGGVTITYLSQDAAGDRVRVVR
jgi:uncharacterized protein YjdB